MPAEVLLRRWPGLTEWSHTDAAMRQFTLSRTQDTADELWLVEHPPVYTLGLATRSEHLLNTGHIPVVQTNRGGQVTYHGPGQLIVYVLWDLRRAQLQIREVVYRLEQAVIEQLGALGLGQATRKSAAPGVYLPWPAPHDPLAKISALGLKVTRGCCYHGLALNVDMDLSPFLGINPCGYSGLQTIDLRTCGVQSSVAEQGEALAARIAGILQR